MSRTNFSVSAGFKRIMSRATLPLFLIPMLFVIFWILYPTPNDHESCTSLPEGFGYADLIGTWVADSYVYPITIDTLVLRDDHRYMQTVEIEFSDEPEYYESGWNEWWYEPADGGIGYLHLYGYRDCGIDGVRCDNAYSKEYQEDICNQINVHTEPEEVILIVKGTQEGFALTKYPIELIFPRGYEASPWVYVILVDNIEMP